MSADNTIVVLGTKRTFIQEGNVYYNHGPEHMVYRVAHVQAWDNFDYYQREQHYNLGAYLIDTFGESKVFLDKQEALTYAYELESSIGYVEYGIQVEDTDLFFYGEW